LNRSKRADHGSFELWRGPFTWNRGWHGLLGGSLVADSNGVRDLRTAIQRNQSLWHCMSEGGMWRSCLVAIVWWVGLAVSIWPARAGHFVFNFGSDLAANDWHYLSFPGRQGAQFRARGENTVVVRAEAGVGVLWHSVPLELSGASYAQWRWRVMAGVSPTDLTRKGGDDRALAVYFVFVDGPEAVESADLTELLRQGEGYLLMYVWGGSANPGTILLSPYFDGRGRTLVKRAADAPTRVWLKESADLRSDFWKAFGRVPGTLIAVAVSSDSDDTGGLNIAAVADLDVN
jgi:Protein of unknown function (DUF3047)